MVKRLLILVLPILLVLSAGLYFIPAESASAKANQSKNSVQNNKTVIVYYFYGNPRCATCQKIEKYTKEAVAENFSKEIKSKKVSFQAVDLDNPKNKHFSKDYNLYTKSVIVSERKNGKEIKYKNLDKIWTLTNDEKKFKDYINKEVKSSLGG